MPTPPTQNSCVLQALLLLKTASENPTAWTVATTKELLQSLKDNTPYYQICQSKTPDNSVRRILQRHPQIQIVRPGLYTIKEEVKKR
jgi:hypothetical protein